MGDLAHFLLAGERLVRRAVYTRQSVTSDDDLSSCQVQFEQCESLVRSMRSVGWLLLPERFDDEGYSGATTDRPALQRLLALVRTGAVDQVVIHRLNRLSRSMLGCATLLQEFRGLGVGLIIATAQELGDSAQDGFMLNIPASFAEFERQMIAGRIAESRARLKARGLRMAGAVPFGYDADPRSKQLVPNPEEAAVVKWVFEQTAAGRTPAEIAGKANANGWRTKEHTAHRTAKTSGGSLWTARQVIATLRNPVYLGLFREKRDLRIGHHEPIVRHELFVAAAAQLEARRTREPGKRYMIDGPLKGRIVCAVCDRPMSPHTIRYRNFIYRYYRCRSTAGGRAVARSRRRPSRLRLLRTFPLDWVSGTIECIQILVEHGARWVPADQDGMNSARRELLRCEPQVTVTVVKLMAQHEACPEETLEQLLDTPEMRAHLSQLGMRLLSRPPLRR